MNILIDIRALQFPHLSGVGEYTYQLVDHLLKLESGHHFILWTNGAASLVHTESDRALKVWSASKKVTVLRTRFPNKILNLSLFLSGWPRIDRIAARLAGRPVDVLFMPNLHFIGFGKGVHVVVTVHDLSFEWYPEFFSARSVWWHRLIRPRVLLSRADHIVAVSKRTKQDVVSHFGIAPQRITAIYPGSVGIDESHLEEHAVERKRVRHSYRLPREYVLFLGTREPRKNIESLLAAYKIAAQRIENMPDLVIGGLAGWKEKPIMRAVRSLGMPGNVHVVGFIKPEDKRAVYGGASLFIYPSYYEGFGFPPLEAMAQGVPVIASYSGSLAEVLGQGAVLIDPYNIEDIAVAMVEVLSSEPLRKRLMEKGFEQVRKYQWKQCAEQVLQVMEAKDRQRRL